jgi:fructokinase
MADGEILCVGELLWDSLPAGLFLGGAPFNVACHLSASGTSVAMVSRVGDDRLGEEALRRAKSYGVRTDLVQVDRTLRTGFVRATIDESGEARYEILGPAAWDAIEADETLVRRAMGARAIVFGSLAQRDARTRATVERLWRSTAMMVFDLNLRPPYEDREIVARSLRRADVVKVTRDELRWLSRGFQLPKDERSAAAEIARSFSCDVVCVTRGSEGAALWRRGEWTEHAGFPVEVRDTVGAGDAFLAVLLTGLLADADSHSLLHNANLIGAYVSTQFGAVPADQPTSAPRTPGKASRRL